MFRSCPVLAFFIAASSAIGCQMGAAVPDGRGFGYACGALAGADASCNVIPGLETASTDAQLPDRFAVGSTFRTAFWKSARGAAVAPAPVLSESPGIVSAKGGAFRVEKPGPIALVALGPDDAILGRARVEAYQIDHVGFDRYSDDSQTIGEQAIARVRLERLGDRTLLRAVPMNAEGDVLGGALACSWTSLNPGVVSIEGAASGNVVTVVAKGSGATMLHVELGGAIADLPITVGREP